MSTIIYWFRNDLRLKDNPAFLQACTDAHHLMPIYIHPPGHDEITPWGFPRVGEHRQKFLKESIQDLRANLNSLGSDLIEFIGDPEQIFTALQIQLKTNIVYCETIEAPEEIAQISALKKAGFAVTECWQSSMLDAKDLPFELQNIPDIFTQFRQQIEKTEPVKQTKQSRLRFTNPIEAPSVIPKFPTIPPQIITSNEEQLQPPQKITGLFQGGETALQAHIEQYFVRRLPDTYKQTRNQLIGLDYSSKFSPWLAHGCCSARMLAKKIDDYEAQYGANDGTYWLWFELLWRDYFRFIHFKYGKKLYRSKGLSDKPAKQFNLEKFNEWSRANTGEKLVDCGMRELNLTGYLSNRMRQIVASYWIYDMSGDWQAGAAWFESQLVDYDVYSNQGNWLYIAGHGTDPRGGRAFNVKKQTQDHDPCGLYQKMWLA